MSDKQLSCLVCYKKFKWCKSLLQHKKAKHDDDKQQFITCTSCDRGFNLHSDALTHWLTEHLPMQQTHVCGIVINK